MNTLAVLSLRWIVKHEKTIKLRSYIIVSITPSTTINGEDETAGWHWENVVSIFYVALNSSPDNHYISGSSVTIWRQSKYGLILELWEDKFPLTKSSLKIYLRSCYWTYLDSNLPKAVILKFWLETSRQFQNKQKSLRKMRASLLL